MSHLIEGGYALSTMRRSDFSPVITHSNLANRAQAISVAIAESVMMPEVTIYGYKQSAGGRHPLDFMVKDGAQLPMFEVIS
jgi:hypothetical protein